MYLYYFTFVSFLKSRDAWLKKVMQSVQTSNPYTYVSIIGSSPLHKCYFLTQPSPHFLVEQIDR